MKPWYLSKTIWLNAITLLVGVLGYLIGHETVQDYPALVSVFVAVQGGLNVLLRFVTVLPVSTKPTS